MRSYFVTRLVSNSWVQTESPFVVRLECCGAISARCNPLRLPGSSDSAASASERWSSTMLARMVLISPPDSPTSASQSAGITGMSHLARLILAIIYIH
ncbi:hypothetical protein AAY473_018903, partial [Plecturocebus cupreus]